MTTVNNRPNVGGVAAMTPQQAGVPAWLGGLLAVNPRLGQLYKTDPGLRAFLDANKGNIVEWTAPPPGRVADRVTWEVWCHATATVPAAVRDEEYIIVVARGTAYRNAGEVTFPLQNGRSASSDGRIVFVGKTADYLANQRPADEGGAYPGAIAVQIQLPVAGDAGEAVSLAYCRAKPDVNGRMHPSQSGWPDSFVGVFGGYSGRELDIKVAGGRRQFADAPLGCSQSCVGRFI